MKIGSKRTHSKLFITKQRFQLGKLHPGRAIFSVKDEELLVEDPAAVELAKLNLEVDVAPKQLRLWTLAERGAERSPRRVGVLLSDLELGVEKPDLGEGEHLVRDQV